MSTQFMRVTPLQGYGLALLVLVIDQVTKHIFKNSSFATTNTGAAFGLFPGMTPALIVISVIALFVIIYYFASHPLPLGLLLGGTLGNLIDRIFFGHVIDFIDFKVWPVFNIADTANVLGVLLLIYTLHRKEKKATLT